MTGYIAYCKFGLCQWDSPWYHYIIITFQNSTQIIGSQENGTEALWKIDLMISFWVNKFSPALPGIGRGKSILLGALVSAIALSFSVPRITCFCNSAAMIFLLIF